MLLVDGERTSTASEGAPAGPGRCTRPGERRGEVRLDHRVLREHDVVRSEEEFQVGRTRLEHAYDETPEHPLVNGSRRRAHDQHPIEEFVPVPVIGHRIEVVAGRARPRGRPSTSVVIAVIVSSSIPMATQSIGPRRRPSPAQPPDDTNLWKTENCGNLRRRYLPARL